MFSVVGFALLQLVQSAAVTSLPTTLSPYKWEVEQGVNMDIVNGNVPNASSITSKPALIGPKSDIIAMPLGYSIMHYNITSKKSVLYDDFTNGGTVVTIFGVKGSNIAYAGGLPKDQLPNNIGQYYKIDFSEPNPKWRVEFLPFPLRFTIRHIHGSADNNIWMTSGAGGIEKNTGALLHFDGKKWVKKLDNAFESVGLVHANGPSIWVTMGDGSLLHSTDYFQTSQVVAGKVRNFEYGPFWGSGKPGEPLYALSYLYDGLSHYSLHRINNPECGKCPNPVCKPKFPIFWEKECTCPTACGTIEKLYELPPADTLDSFQTFTGGIPGAAPDMFFIVGGGGFGAFWNGKTLIKDNSMIPSNDAQSTYLEVFAKDNYLYAVSTATFIAKKRLF
jgi:hypothetical protein